MSKERFHVYVEGDLSSEDDELYPLHTEGRPFCGESACSCHEDQAAINTLYGQYQDGLVTAEERDNLYKGVNV